MKQTKEKKYWEEIISRANKQCITCEFCFPNVISHDDTETYEKDYSKCICATHGGQVEYGQRLSDKQLMNEPDCWSLGLDEYIRVAKQEKGKTKCKG